MKIKLILCVLSSFKGLVSNNKHYIYYVSINPVTIHINPSHQAVVAVLVNGYRSSVSFDTAGSHCHGNDDGLTPRAIRTLLQTFSGML